MTAPPRHCRRVAGARALYGRRTARERADADGGLDRRGRARPAAGRRRPEAVPRRSAAGRARAAPSPRCSPIPAIDLRPGGDPPRRPRALRRRASPASPTRGCAPPVAGGADAAPARSSPGSRRSPPRRPTGCSSTTPPGPSCRPALIAGVLAALDEAPAALPALPVVDALWRGAGGRATAPVAARRPLAGADAAGLPLRRRSSPRTAPTAARRADDAAVARAAGLAVAARAGRRGELQDHHRRRPRAGPRAHAERPWTSAPATASTCTPSGPATGVTLCGVAIPFDRGLVGHSDADVGLHALTDAIFGALAEGDIGQWFPPSDPRLEGRRLGDLPAQGRRARRATAASPISHLDCTLVCEAPKIGPHARGDARGARRHRRHRRRSGSASRRRPPSGSASPAAARASPRSPPRRWCGRDPRSSPPSASSGCCRSPPAPGARSRRCRPATCCTGSAASRCSPLATAVAYGARLLGDAGRDLRRARPRPRRTSSSTRSSASGSRSCRSRPASGSPARRRTLFPWPGWVSAFLLFRLLRHLEALARSAGPTAARARPASCSTT